MTELTNSSEFTAEEAAYFESGGETALAPAPAEPPPAAEPAKPEQEGDPQPQDRDENGRWVSHKALHAEREEHKKTRAELQQLRERQGILDDRWNTLLKLRGESEKPPEVETPPDPETDIFGFAKWQADQLSKLQARLDDGEKQTTQQRQIEEQERGIWNDWEQSVREYGSATPEFGEAAKFLADLRSSQIKGFAALDPNLSTPAGINAQINAELRAIVVQCRQAGVSPAKFVHDLAVSYGFKAAAPDPKTMALPEKLAGIAAAQEAAKTVGQSQGRAGADALTPEAIALMTPAEFDRWASDPKNAAMLDKMLGA